MLTHRMSAIVQFTEHTSGIKIRGKAEIYTHYGIIRSGDEEEGVTLIGRNEHGTENN